MFNMIRCSSNNNIIYDNESKIKKLHSKNKIKEIIIPIFKEVKSYDNINKDKFFENNDNILFNKRLSNILPSNKIQEKRIILNKKTSEIEEEKKNDWSQIMDIIPINKTNNIILDKKIENKKIKNEYNKKEENKNKIIVIKQDENINHLNLNNNNIMNNNKYINKEENNQLFDMREFSFGKKNNNIKFSKKISEGNICKFSLNESIIDNIEINILIKYLFNIIGISCELNKISPNMNFNDLTFLSKKDLECLGFGIISRNRLCNIVKNFSKFIKDKKESFDISNNNKNLKYLYEFLSKNKEIIVDKKSYIELENKYNDYLNKKKMYLEKQYKKSFLSKKNKFNKFPLKSLSRNKSMSENLVINNENNYFYTKGFSSMKLILTNNNKSYFKSKQKKLYETYSKLYKEVDKYFDKEKKRVFFSLKKIEKI